MDEKGLPMAALFWFEIRGVERVGQERSKKE